MLEAASNQRLGYIILVVALVTVIACYPILNRNWESEPVRDVYHIQYHEKPPIELNVTLMIFASKMLSESCLLVKSAIANGLQVDVVGWAGSKAEPTEHITRTVSREYARRLNELDPTTLVLGLDGFDTVLSRAATPAELASRFSDFRSQFVWSAEANMYPSFDSMPANVQRDYPGQWPVEWHSWKPPMRWKKPLYPYLNYGGWIAHAGKAAEVMAAVSKYVSPCAARDESLHPPGGCPAAHDQHAAQLVLVEDVCRKQSDEGARCALDVYGGLFYSGWPNCPGLVPHASGLWSNTLAGNQPLVVHFNGDAKTECTYLGLRDYMYSKRTGWYNRVPFDEQTQVHVSNAKTGFYTSFASLCPEQV